jgi:esterase/lipase
MNFNAEQITIKIASEKLAGLLFIPQLINNSTLPSIVIFHGRGSSKKRYLDRAQALVEHGFLTLVFDFRGCGESDGKLIDKTNAMGFEDALAGYDFLVSHKLCDKKRVGILGGSFGGYQAALLSEKRPIHSLVLAAPDIYQDEWWNMVPETMDPERKGLYKQQSGFENTKAMKAINKYSGSILIIEHEQDEIIPQRITQSYYDNAVRAAVREKKIIYNAPHALYDQKFLTESKHIVTSLFVKTL